MSLLQRIKNLWALTDFKISEFDNKLVITKIDNKLVFASPEKPVKKRAEGMSKIIKKKGKDPIEEIVNG